MNNWRVPISLLCGLCLLVTLGWIMPANGRAESGPAQVLAQATDEPPTRETAAPVPHIEVTPNVGVAGQALPITVEGYCFSRGSLVTLTFDGGGRFLGQAHVSNDPSCGVFSANVVVPAEWATEGPHQVFAVDTHGLSDSASVTLSTAPPTATYTPTGEPPTGLPPTDRPPTATKGPVTPSVTPSPTQTPTPMPSMRPLTPVYTATPKPAHTQAPYHATHTPVPATDVPSSTPTPTIQVLPTSTFLPTETPFIVVFVPTRTPVPTLEMPLPAAAPSQAPVAAVISGAVEAATPVGFVPPPLSVREQVGMPAAGRGADALSAETLRRAVVIVLLGGVFLAVFIPILIAMFVLMIRMLRRIGLMKLN